MPINKLELGFYQKQKVHLIVVRLLPQTQARVFELRKTESVSKLIEEINKLKEFQNNVNEQSIIMQGERQNHRMLNNYESKTDFNYNHSRSNVNRPIGSCSAPRLSKSTQR